jgi:opacity protein-like surface antigen
MDAGILGFSVLKRTMDITRNQNSVDWGVTGGLGYTFSNGFNINAGYDHGLSRIDKNSQFDSYNRSFKVGIGFRF